MKTIVTPLRTLVLFALVVVGSMVYASARPTAAQDHDKQCWRWFWEPIDSCTMCGFSCLGDIFLCCEFSVESDE